MDEPSQSVVGFLSALQAAQTPLRALRAQLWRQGVQTKHHLSLGQSSFHVLDG